MFNEQWDDYQLKSLALGGNQKVFDIILEYKLESKSLFITYKHACLQWYKEAHIARMDGVRFDKERPAKTWGETFQQTQSYFVESLDGNFSYAKKMLEAKFRNND